MESVNKINQLCIFFNGQFGYLRKGECELKKRNIPLIKNAAVTNSVELFDEYLNKKSIKQIVPNELYVFEFENGHLEMLARESLYFEKVIIKKEQDISYDSEPWYYSPTESPIPSINTRNYIKVVKDFELVEIDSNIKGSKITFDDILFASRCFMIDGYRVVDKYKILSLTDSVLELEPSVDNFD